MKTVPTIRSFLESMHHDLSQRLPPSWLLASLLLGLACGLLLRNSLAMSSEQIASVRSCSINSESRKENSQSWLSAHASEMHSTTVVRDRSEYE